MTVNLGTSSADWQMWQREQYAANTSKLKGSYVSSTNNTQQTQTITKTSENTCTDGKDDGKIGFFSALGHTVKGAAKGLWNGIKGCFTNSEGKFSIGKTLLTVGAAALCIAFPAVGLVACGIGAVSGAVTLGKGIYNAATAETDAQAKDAWENIGDGAFTVASSVVGAKASFKAVKATSTAGISSIDDAAKAAEKAGASLDKIDDIQKLDKVDDAIKAVKEIGGDTSKLGNLAEDATKLDKAKALLSDSWSSTKNQGVKVLAKGTELKNEAKLNKEAKEYNKAKEEIRGYEEKIAKGETLSENETAHFDKLSKKTGDTSAATKQRALELADAENQKFNMKKDIKTQKETVKDLRKEYKEIKKNGTEADIKTAKEYYDNAKIELKTMQEESSTFGKLTSKGRKAATDAINDSETAQSLNNQKATLTEGLGEKPALHPIETAKTIKNNLKNVDYANIRSGLSTDGKAILDALKDGSKTYNQLANEYGYNNVIQVIEAAQGYIYAKEAV